MVKLHHAVAEHRSAEREERSVNRMMKLHHAVAEHRSAEREERSVNRMVQP